MMRLSFLIIWASFLLSEVHTLNPSVPYELLYLYYAYKAEFTAFPNASDRKIGTKCTHMPTAEDGGDEVEIAIADQGLQGICTFREFVRNVLKQASFKRYKQIKYSGITIDPDWKAAAAFPYEKDPPMIYLEDKIAPYYKPKGNAPDPKTGNSKHVPLVLTLRYVTGRLQAARKIAVAKPDISSRMAAIVTKASDYAELISQFRTKDQFDVKLADFKTLSKWPQFMQSTTKTILDPTGNQIPTPDGKEATTSYVDIDIDKTINNAGDQVNEDDKAAFKQWSKDFSGKPAFKQHQEIIKTANNAITQLASSNAGCK